MRKYGLENFAFEVLEECQIDELNAREKYWIKQKQPQYNQTIGEDFLITHSKLTPQQVMEIQNLLSNDITGNIKHEELAQQYNVHRHTIDNINLGISWVNEQLKYPLHCSKFGGVNSKTPKTYCRDCGIEIAKGSMRCAKCENIHRHQNTPITREELKKLIRTTPFTRIGAKYGVSDNAIRKWCDKHNLPRKASEIKKYSDEEWEKL